MSSSKTTVLVLLALAAAGALLLVLDPLGLLGLPAREAGAGAADDLGAGGPRLEGAGPAGRRAPATAEDGLPVGVLTLTLGDGRLTGRVTGSGAPLAGARVEPVLPPPFRAALRTDAEGRYEIRGLPEGQHDVRASKEGWRGRTEVAPLLARGAVAEVPTIDLLPRPELADGLEVKVTDLDGRPLAGARVLATTLPWDLHLAMGPERAGVRDAVFKSGVSDEQGLARLTAMQPQTYSVAVTAPGMCTLAWAAVVVARGRVEKLTARLAPGVAIQGRVVDATGAPVPGARVLGFHQPSFMSSVMATAGADGAFTLDGLRPGRYWLMSFEDTRGRGQANPVTSPSAGTLIRLGGTGTVEGRVLDASGQPVPDATIRPHSAEPFGYVYSQVVKAKADGTFSLPLTPGAWSLDAWNEAGVLSQGNKVKVELGKPSQTTITLPATGRVTGVVTDADGNHVEGAEVFVRMGGFPPGPNREQYARTDADGAFTVKGLGLETVKLHVRHPRYASTVWEGTPSAAAQPQPVTIRLGRGARLVGHVRGPQGRGVAGEQVNLFQNWFEPRTVFTDAEGAFAFEAVTAGTWQVSTGVFENGAPGEVRSGIVVGSEGTVVVDFDVAAEGRGVLTGSVRLSGAPAAGAMVRVQDPSGSGAEVSTTTAADGTFRLEGVPTGSVRVFVQTLDGNSIVRFAEVDDKTLTGTLVVALGSSAVRGRVLSAAGEPVAGAWVTLEILGGEGDVWSRVKAQKTTATDGTYEAKGLEGGTYVLRVSAGEHAQHLSEPFPLEEGGARDLGDLRLQAGVTLTGRVTNDQGTPVEDATVSLKDAQGRPVFNFSLSTTGSDGRYAVHGLVPGSYTVRFEARGLSPDERAVTVSASGASQDGVLSRGGSVTVTVEDDAGRPLAGARLSLTDARGAPVTRTLSLVNLFDGDGGRSGEDGVATLSDLAAGTYRVRATREGWVQDGDEPAVVVPPGGGAATRVRLKRAP